MRFLSLSAILFVFWFLLSGHTTLFLIAAGVLTAVAVAAFGKILGFTDREGHPVELALRALVYWPWLIKEILVSAFDVAVVIVRPSLPISPRLMTVDTSQNGPVGLVAYANSITLTPGTITVQVFEPRRQLLVHALTEKSAAGLASGDMDRRVTAMASDA